MLGTGTRESPREERAVTTARDSGHCSAPEARPPLGSNPVLLTNPSLLIPAVSAPWPARQPRVEGARCLLLGISAEIAAFEPFVRSDALCLPTEIMKPLPTQSFLPHTAFQGRAQLCREHSLIASAEAQRRQQPDFLLLIP